MYLVVRGIKSGGRWGGAGNWDKGGGVENYCSTSKQKESLFQLMLLLKIWKKPPTEFYQVKMHILF